MVEHKEEGEEEEEGKLENREKLQNWNMWAASCCLQADTSVRQLS